MGFGDLARVLTIALVVAWAVAAGPRPPQASPGGTIDVPAGGSLQQALNRARPGDTIVLEAGATYTGPFRLPRKNGDGWIEIRTSAVDAGTFPAAGERVTPAHAGRMAVLESASGSVLVADPGAHHYRLIGLEIRPAPRTALVNLVDLGSRATRRADTPHDLAIERCYVHGDAVLGSRRGVALNSASTLVADSYFADFKTVGSEAQAIAGWNGPGPYVIRNNHLEAAGENVMFGGADPLIEGLVPSDIEVRRNHFTKPLSWRSPAKGTPAWTVKNLFELKNARRVTIDGNVFEHNWPAAQTGFAILFTPRNQEGRAPWSRVEDVAFTNNVVRRVAAGVSILGRDNNHPSGPAARIRIANNLFVEVGGAWGGGGVIQVLNGVADVRIEHNTAVHTGTPLFLGDDDPHPRLVFEDNIVVHNDYGILGSDTGVGRPSLERYVPGAVIRGNAIVGGPARLYPPGNFFPPSLDAVGFVNPAAGDYRLSPGSVLRGRAGDGGDVGADLEALRAALGQRAARVGLGFSPAPGGAGGPEGPPDTAGSRE